MFLFEAVADGSKKRKAKKEKILQGRKKRTKKSSLKSLIEALPSKPRTSAFNFVK
jgi:hypothetical protein